MAQIDKLTEIQYDILVELEDYTRCKGFNWWTDKYDRKTLKKEFKILRELELVDFWNGLMDDDGNVCGSGYCKNSEKEKEIDKLVEDYESNLK